MARRCDLSGCGPASGNRVSHSNRKTKRRFLPNLIEQRFWSAKQNRWVRVKITTRALRTIKKLGFDRAVKRLGDQ